MARSFNGSSDIINLGAPAALNITGNLSFCCWFNINSFASMTMFEHGFDGTNEGYTLRISTSSGFGGGAQNYVQVIAFLSSASLTGGVEFATTPANGSWHHLAGLWNGTGWGLFYDGVAQFTNGSNSTGPTSSTANVSIGGAYISGTPSRFWNGSIADAAIWNVVVSNAEVAALASGARPNTIRPSSLVGYWPLTGLQSPEPDLSGNKNNGTLTGTANAFGPPLMPFTPRWHRYNGLMVPAAGLKWMINRRDKLGWRPK